MESQIVTPQPPFSKKRYPKEYNAWRSMRKRCNLPSHKAYPWYGGRGIRVCKRWDGPGKFDNFLLDLGACPNPQFSLDRINNDLGYSPNNCCWTSVTQQNRNKSNCVWWTIDGRTALVADWAKEFNIDRGTLFTRIANGWDIEKALKTPLQGSSAPATVEYHGEMLLRNALADRFGIPRPALKYRLTCGWDLETALKTPVRKRKTKC